MTDLNPEGLEKAAEALAGESDDLYWCTRVWEAWGYGTMDADDFTPISDEPDILSNLARAAVSAYLGHTVVTTVEELDALPVGTVVRSGAGTIACHYGNGLGVVFGDERPFSWDRIALPATVIYRPTP